MTAMSPFAGAIGAKRWATVADGIEIVRGFPEAARARVAALYWDAFRGKLGRVLGPDAKALRFLAPVLQPDYAFSALDGEGTLLGVAGFSTPEDTFVSGEMADLTRVYGRFGAIWRAGLLEFLERPKSDEILVMDGIFVAPGARGRGVGSALLDRIVEEAKARGLSGVRLDVIDTNPRARALYERKGFEAQEAEQLGPLKWVFGFAASTPMIKAV